MTTRIVAIVIGAVAVAACSGGGGGGAQGLPDFELATSVVAGEESLGSDTVAPITAAEVAPGDTPAVTAPRSTVTTTTLPVFPRVVEHALGSAEIPALPEQIVAISGVADFDALLSLGVVPHAAAAFFPIDAAGSMAFAPWNMEYWGDVPSFLNRPQVNLEELAAFEPDLIVGQVGSVHAEESMSAIAPIAAYDFPADWREPLRILGDALGREIEAVEAIALVEAQLAEIAERVPDGGLTVAMITNGSGGNFTVYTPEHGAGIARALEEIGISYVDVPSSLSKERLGDLAPADWVVVYDFAVFDVNELVDDPLFQQLPAVQAGNVVQYDPIQTFSTLFETSRGLPFALNVVLESIGL